MSTMSRHSTIMCMILSLYGCGGPASSDSMANATEDTTTPAQECVTCLEAASESISDTCGLERIQCEADSDCVYIVGISVDVYNDEQLATLGFSSETAHLAQAWTTCACCDAGCLVCAPACDIKVPSGTCQ